MYIRFFNASTVISKQEFAISSIINYAFNYHQYLGVLFCYLEHTLVSALLFSDVLILLMFQLDVTLLTFKISDSVNLPRSVRLIRRKCGRKTIPLTKVAITESYNQTYTSGRRKYKA